MASPSTISRIRSKGASDESSRRPMTRVRKKTKTKRTIPRSAMSMPCLLAGSRERHERAAQHRDAPVAVEELDVLRVAADVRRVHLELEVEPVGRARPDVSQREGDASVLTGLADRGGLDGVERKALEPAGLEHQPRLLQLLPCVDAEACLEEEAAAHRAWSLEPELRGRRGGLRRRRPLPEDVGERRGRDDGQEKEQPAPDPGLVPATLEVPVPAQNDAVGGSCHEGELCPVSRSENAPGVTPALSGGLSSGHDRLARHLVRLKPRSCRPGGGFRGRVASDAAGLLPPEGGSAGSPCREAPAGRRDPGAIGPRPDPDRARDVQVAAATPANSWCRRMKSASSASVGCRLSSS